MQERAARQIWEAALGQLQLQVNKANYQTWLKGSAGLGYSDHKLTVEVPTTFAKEWLEKRLHTLVKRAVAGIVGLDTEVVFQTPPRDGGGNPPSSAPALMWAAGAGTLTATPEVNSQPSPASEHNAAPAAHPTESRPPGEAMLTPRFNPKYTFATFVVGSSNRVAHAAALAVSEKPGLTYNPLFIYGGTGLGKTHLLHAIGHVALKSTANIGYVTSEQFTNAFVTAIRERNTEAFRAKFRSVNLLLIDDVQFIAGKEQTEEALFHTMNELHNAGRQMIITSDRPPRAMALLEDRLRSRFEWGLMADIQPPDLETRLVILKAKAEELGAQVPQPVLDVIARRLQKNIRELEGALNRLVAYARLTGVPVTMELAQQVLADVGTNASRRIAPAQILQAVASYFAVEEDALRGGRRDRKIALPRQVAMYLLREELQRSWVEIGRLLMREHSTVLRGYEKIAAEITANPELRRSVLEIREALYQKKD